MDDLRIIHVLNDGKTNSVCGKAQAGDRGITLEQARDMNNDLYFDCVSCYELLAGEEPE